MCTSPVKGTPPAAHPLLCPGGLPRKTSVCHAGGLTIGHQKVISPTAEACLPRCRVSRALDACHLTKPRLIPPCSRFRYAPVFARRSCTCGLQFLILFLKHLLCPRKTLSSIGLSREEKKQLLAQKWCRTIPLAIFMEWANYWHQYEFKLFGYSNSVFII